MSELTVCKNLDTSSNLKTSLMSQPRQRLIAVSTRLLLVLAVLLMAGWVSRALIATAPVVERDESPRSARRVVVFRAQQVPVGKQWSGYGTAEALTSAQVPSRVTATVTHIPDTILAGAVVERGQLLAQLDDSDFRQQADIAQHDIADLEAQLVMIDVEQQRVTDQLQLDTEDVALATSELQRIEKLQARGAAHEQEIDRTKRVLIAAQRIRVQTQQSLQQLEPRRRQLTAQLASRTAQLKLAELQLQRCKITSPITGVLQSVEIEEGENVTAGQQIARVVDLSRIEVPIRLPAAARADVTVGDPVELTTSSRRDQTWRARVARVAPEDDPTTRTMTVFVEVNQPREHENERENDPQDTTPSHLSPGLFLTGITSGGVTRPRLIVPRRSLNEGRVITVDAGVIRSQPVEIDYTLQGIFPQLGVADEQWAVLRTPLADDVLVVINASASLVDGQEVDPIIVTPLAPAAARSLSQGTGGGSEP